MVSETSGASKQENSFTLKTDPGYSVFTTYFDNVGYDPHLHDGKPDCIP